MGVSMGWRPPPITINVSNGGTFAAALVRKTANWDAGDTIDLQFTGSGAPITWVATIAGDRAEWSKTVAQVAALISADNRSASLRHTPSGGEPTILYRGTVNVH